LEITLDDLREVLKDLLPSLREMTKTAYSKGKESTDEEQIRQAKRLLKKVNSLEPKQVDRKA
jgi:thioredoxin-like negative regulator of GroEL